MTNTARSSGLTVPALLAPPEAPLIGQSSPHILSLTAFEERFGGSPRRRTLLTALAAELAYLKRNGVTPLCLLAGGGFVRDGAEPGDFDALIAYALASGAQPDAIRSLLTRRPLGLDLRFVPSDAGPLPLMRMSCFFHTLYQARDRGGAQASFLVPLER